MREETDRQGSAATEERRALERAAYGRDGGLDAAGARRLRELQEEHRRQELPAEERPTAASEALPVAEDEGRESDPPPASDASPPAAAGAPPAPVETGERMRARGVVPVLAAAAALLAIGVGTGWALFAPRSDAFPLTEAQEQRRTELAGEDYDPGSVRAVAEAEGALAWFATQDDGASRCLILDVGEDSQSTCLATEEELGPGLYAALPVVASDAADDEDSFSTDSVTAVMLFSTADEPMVSIQRWGGSSTLVAQFGEEQRARVEELVRDGYDLNLTLLGSFREQPVWLGDRRTATGPAQRCLIVDADGSRQCATLDEALQSGLRVQLLDVDQETGELLSASVIEVAFTRWQMPYLTVTSGPAVVDEATGESYLVTTGPPGDPIRVDIPGRDPDG